MGDVKCWGCECEVPVRDGYHEEPYECPEHGPGCEDEGRIVYRYPCKRTKEVTRG